MDENELSKIIVEASIEVHRALGGPGLLESVYNDALFMEMRQRGLCAEREKLIPVIYKGQLVGDPLRVDFLN